MDTVWGVVGIVWGAMFGVGYLLLENPTHVRFGQVLVVGSAILLGGWCFAWYFMTDQETWVRVVIGLLVGSFVFVVAPETIRRLSATEGGAPVTKKDDGKTVINQNVTSHNQSGGITAHTVNVGPQRLTFDSAIAAELLRHMPKGKPVLAESAGSSADHAVAAQYLKFLEANGFTIKNWNRSGMILPPPAKKIVIQVLPDQTVLIIAPSAN